MDQTIEQLNSFRLPERLAALRTLAARRPAAPQDGRNVNMHVHSFFSYNARGQSPCRIAWEAREAGLFAVGLCDFDVLDGLEEFHQAGCLLGVRTAVNLETRAYLREFAQADINSPGEPGVTYVMGAGFGRVPSAGTPALDVLHGYRERARARNLALVRRVNERLPAIAIDYERDVLPLTPAGVATERHIVRAYARRSAQCFGEGAAWADFWAGVLALAPAAVAALRAREAAFEEQVRSKLAKRGGLGYEPPTPDTFPPVDDFIAWVLSCRAIPTITWLDGTSEGERDPVRMIECLMAKGAAALNIIPDRNWNIQDPASRRLKVAKLSEIVDAAERFHLPVNIGTEMNRDGQPSFDDLAGEELRPFAETFLRGARIMVGHSLLRRYADLSFVGPETLAEFRGDLVARNLFFERAGALPPLTEPLARRLVDMGREKALEVLSASTAVGQWRLR